MDFDINGFRYACESTFDAITVELDFLRMFLACSQFSSINRPIQMSLAFHVGMANLTEE